MLKQLLITVFSAGCVFLAYMPSALANGNIGIGMDVIRQVLDNGTPEQKAAVLKLLDNGATVVHGNESLPPAREFARPAVQAIRAVAPAARAAIPAVQNAAAAARANPQATTAAVGTGAAIYTGAVSAPAWAPWVVGGVVVGGVVGEIGGQIYYRLKGKAIGKFATDDIIAYIRSTSSSAVSTGQIKAIERTPTYGRSTSAVVIAPFSSGDNASASAPR